MLVLFSERGKTENKDKRDRARQVGQFGTTKGDGSASGWGRERDSDQACLKCLNEDMSRQKRGGRGKVVRWARSLDNDLGRMEGGGSRRPEVELCLRSE